MPATQAGAAATRTATAGIQATPSTTAGLQADSTPTTTTRPPFVNCAATLPEVRGAQPVQIANVDFPVNGAAIVTILSRSSATLQVVQYTACMQVFAKGTVGHVSVPIVSNTSSPAAEVTEALGLVNRGWYPNPVFPFDGERFQSCTRAQMCYSGGGEHYAELEKIVDHSNGVMTFILRMAAPQPLLSCDPALFAVDYYADSTAVLGDAEFPLPPVTRMSMGYGDSQGITTYFCTAGDAAAIQSFMDHHLPEWGWSPLTVNGVLIWKFPSGGIGPVYVRIYPITDPRKWAILTYEPGVDLG